MSPDIQSEENIVRPNKFHSYLVRSSIIIVNAEASDLRRVKPSEDAICSMGQEALIRRYLQWRPEDRTPASATSSPPHPASASRTSVQRQRICWR
jgi:hypothetical protein